MPTIQAQGQTIDCPIGANLRKVLLEHDIALYTGPATVVNCRSLGTCGTCCVTIDGPVSELTWKEKGRLNFPPHLGAGTFAKKRRLACQVEVLGDIRVTKYEGFWGQLDTVRW
jgi:ferredoxin